MWGRWTERPGGAGSVFTRFLFGRDSFSAAAAAASLPSSLPLMLPLVLRTASHRITAHRHHIAQRRHVNGSCVRAGGATAFGLRTYLSPPCSVSAPCRGCCRWRCRAARRAGLPPVVSARLSLHTCPPAAVPNVPSATSLVNLSFFSRSARRSLALLVDVAKVTAVGKPSTAEQATAASARQLKTPVVAQHQCG